MIVNLKPQEYTIRHTKPDIARDLLGWLKLMRYVVFALMIMVLYSLGSACFYMLRSRDSEKMAKALTWRIGLSVLIFVLLFVAFAAGWWQPHEMLAPGSGSPSLPSPTRSQ